MILAYVYTLIMPRKKLNKKFKNVLEYRIYTQIQKLFFFSFMQDEYEYNKNVELNENKKIPSFKSERVEC